MCRECKGDGFIPVKQYYKRRSFILRQKRKQRKAEPFAKYRPCPVCS